MTNADLTRRSTAVVAGDAPVTWLCGPAAEVAAEVARLAEDPRWRLVSADPPDAEHSAFAPVRGLLGELVRLLGEERDLLAECAPELREVAPELDDLLPAGSALGELMQMPLRLARMLPLESELVFRIVARIGWLVEEGSRRLATPLAIHFPRLDEADRPTLVTAYHLAHRMGGYRLLFGVGAPSDVDGVGGGAAARRELCEAIRDGLGGVEVTLSGPVADAPLATGSGTQAQAIRAARRALADHAPDALDRWREAVGSCGRWFNPEAGLDLAHAAAGHPAVPPAEQCQAAGIAEATMGRFSAARDSFSRGYAGAHEPVERARLAMFLGLVTAKRLRDAATAETVVTEGLTGLEALDDADGDAALERGWLLNLDALLAYQRGDHSGALRRTRTAFELMRPHMGDEAIGLKTNLVVNTSIVAESRGEPERALERWRLFLRISDRASDMFTHFYYFRESGLRVRAGDAGALDGYDRVLVLAERLAHLPGLIAAARAGVRLSWLAGDHERALAYARCLPDACRRLGDPVGRRAAWRTIAACAGPLGDASTVDEALSAETGYDDDETRALRDRWRDDPKSVDWAAFVPPPPATMLRYPADLFLPGRSA